MLEFEQYYNKHHDVIILASSDSNSFYSSNTSMKQLQLNVPRKYRRWTETEVSYLKEKYPRSGTKELALHLNRTRVAIKAKAKELGIRKEIIPVWTEEGAIGI